MRGTGAEVKGIGARAVAYMAASMAMPNATGDDVDQDQNWILGHLVTFAGRERRRIRGLIDEWLLELRILANEEEDQQPVKRMQMLSAIRAIDAATRATKGRR